MGGIVLVFFGYLALYTWNSRTGFLDAFATNSGLEATRHILRPAVWVKETVSAHWREYLALVDVAGENARLREELRRAEQFLASVREDQAELARLRALAAFQTPEGWTPLGTRIVAGRFGPLAALESVMLDRGFATGAAPGTPLATHKGVVGQVLRASPHASTALLLTDPGFRVAVISQESRVPGVLAGSGARLPLEVRYVAQNAQLKVGELLITSGLDSEFPKGIPVAKVLAVQPGDETLFQQVQAAPVVQLEEVEEALLLIPPQDMRPSRLRAYPPATNATNTTVVRHNATAGEGQKTPAARRRPAPR